MQPTPAAAPAAATDGGAAAESPAQRAVVTAPASTLALAPAPAPELRVASGPVHRLVDSVDNWLTNTAVTPVTDFLSGALWLVRRTAPVGSGQGSPTACGATCSTPMQTSAATQVLTVTSRVDGQAGSLRDVLSQATDGAVIRFAPRLRGATLKLTQGELDINVSVQIKGTNQTLNPNGLSRIMVLDQPGTAITLIHLNFANGMAPSDPANATAGGAILAEAVTLQISRALFSRNSAVATEPAEPDAAFMQSGLGGAIAAIASTVTISDSDFRTNRAAGANNNKDQQPGAGLGGAIFAEDSSIGLLRSRFTDNAAAGGSGLNPIEQFPSADGGLASGGAIFTTGSGLTADGVTFHRNSALGGDGLNGSASNPYGNVVGGGGNASGGALWMVGNGRDQGDPVNLVLSNVKFSANTATGGTAGAQGLATLGAQQGGRGNAGGFGAVEWVAVSLDDVSVQNNLAQGGGAGANAPDAGANTGTGGVAQGGGAFLISPASVQATHLSVRNNTAQGGRGADSAPQSGTEAGEGGYSYGGGLRVDNATGSLQVQAAVIPVGIRQSEFVRNRAVAGEGGSGPVPADGLGAGGLAQGGGLDFTSLFETRLVGVRFIGNAALASEGKSAAGGGLINPYSVTRPGETATLQIQNGLFRGNTAVGGNDAANPSYRETQGGGFYNLGLGTVVSGSRFVANSAVGGDDTGSGHVGSGLGGGIYSEASADPSIAIYNSRFAGNSAMSGRRLVPGESLSEPASGEAHGGALYAADGTTIISGGSIVRNSATVRVVGDRVAEGGAIEISTAGEGYTNYLHTAGVRFASNAASSPTGQARGGAVSFKGTAFTDDGSTFSGNTASSGRNTGAAYGGAMLLEQTTRLNGTTVTGNTARAEQGFGGGLALPLGPEVLTQVQNDIRRNRASTAGDQVWWPTS